MNLAVGCTALDAGDWHGAYQAATSWIAAGPGAVRVEAWLLQAASGVLHGQPKTAMRSLDLGLKHWLALPPNRAVLWWARAFVAFETLQVRLTEDLAAATNAAPAWLAADVAALERHFSTSPPRRAKKSPFAPAPTFEGPPMNAWGKPGVRADEPTPEQPAQWKVLVAGLRPR